jgi:hypothetical protein
MAETAAWPELRGRVGGMATCARATGNQDRERAALDVLAMMDQIEKEGGWFP